MFEDRRAIAYKDCKTDKDFAAYKRHVQELEEARMVAHSLLQAVIASGQLSLLDQIHGIIDAVTEAKRSYTQDEKDSIHSLWFGMVNS